MRRGRRVFVLIGVCIALPWAARAQTFEAGVKGGIAVTSVPLAGEVLDQVRRSNQQGPFVKRLVSQAAAI